MRTPDMPPCDHEAIKRDPVAWSKLDQLGTMHTPADGREPAETIELANCGACHSTIARTVSP